MTDDLAARLSRLELDRDEQKRRWLSAAAKSQRLHDPQMVADRLIDPARVTTAADADRAVAEFAGQNPYMRSEPAQISIEEQQRAWGQQILDGINRSR
jgi:hypothetical protein